jgi:hypothetical protein
MDAVTVCQLHLQGVLHQDINGKPANPVVLSYSALWAARSHFEDTCPLLLRESSSFFYSTVTRVGCPCTQAPHQVRGCVAY